MGKRCQVCDGPIVNGRCKYCGMPYRNDMELYHLNENRSEHYRHASAKVRKAMKESQVPLPDRNKTGKTNTVRTQASGKTVHAQTVRTYGAGRKTIQDTKTKKSKKCATTFWVIIVVLMVLAGQIVENWDSIGYQIESFIEEELGIDIGSFFAESSAEEEAAEENDWKDDWTEIIDAATSKQDEEEDRKR